jgi:hypothetical protein
MFGFFYFRVGLMVFELVRGLLGLVLMGYWDFKGN